MPRSVRSIERIHIDIAGGGSSLQPQVSLTDEANIAGISREGFKYFMIITDDAIRYQ